MANPIDKQVEALNPGRAALWAELTATYFGCGNCRPGPGTWGSAGAIVTWIAVSHFLPATWLTAGAIVFAALATAVGIPAATRVAQAMHVEDPSKVVIDEVAGQMVALIGAPLNWKAILCGFILFRAFDILKPPPVRQLERLPEGLGIVVDDLAAGLYALIIMLILQHFGFFR